MPDLVQNGSENCAPDSRCEGFFFQINRKKKGKIHKAIGLVNTENDPVAVILYILYLHPPSQFNIYNMTTCSIIKEKCIKRYLQCLQKDHRVRVSHLFSSVLVSYFR